MTGAGAGSRPSTTTSARTRQRTESPAGRDARHAGSAPRPQAIIIIRPEIETGRWPHSGSGPSPRLAGYFRLFAIIFRSAADRRSTPATSANRNTPRNTSASSASTSSRFSFTASWSHRKSASNSPASLEIRAARLRGVWYFSQSRSRANSASRCWSSAVQSTAHPLNTFSLCHRSISGSGRYSGLFGTQIRLPCRRM